MTDSIKEGTEYAVTHSRKGRFFMMITGVTEEWVEGFVTSGKAKALLVHNEKTAGERITVRKSFCRFEPVPKNAQ